MTRLTAIEWDNGGTASPGGAVRYLFERTCYLRTDAGALVLITQETDGVLPNGICVRMAAEVHFTERLNIGDRAATRGGVLRFAGTGLEIDLRGARLRRPARRRREIDPAALAQSCRCAETELRRSPAAAEVISVVGRAQNQDLAGRLDRLLGRGPGLTPVGDDYLVGWLAGYWQIHGAAPDGWHDLNLADTTDVSGALLEGATRGVFPARLMRLADDLFAPNADIGRAVDDLASFGHTSGIGMGFGLIAGLRAAPAAHPTDSAA